MEERRTGRRTKKGLGNRRTGRMETPGRGREKTREERMKHGPAGLRPRCPSAQPSRGEERSASSGAAAPPSTEPQGQGGGAALPSSSSPFPSPSGSPHFSNFP